RPHLLALLPVSLGLEMTLREPPFLQPATYGLGGLGLGGHPREPVRVVAYLDRAQQRLGVARTAYPRHAKAGALDDRQGALVLVGVLEVDLDRDVVGQLAQDAVDTGETGRIANEQISGRWRDRRDEPRRTPSRGGDPVAGLDTLGPFTRRARRVVQHELQRHL